MGCICVYGVAFLKIEFLVVLAKAAAEKQIPMKTHLKCRGNQPVSVKWAQCVISHHPRNAHFRHGPSIRFTSPPLLTVHAFEFLWLPIWRLLLMTLFLTCIFPSKSSIEFKYGGAVGAGFSVILVLSLINTTNVWQSEIKSRQSS